MNSLQLLSRARIGLVVSLERKDSLEDVQKTVSNKVVGRVVRIKTSCAWSRG